MTRKPKVTRESEKAQELTEFARELMLMGIQTSYEPGSAPTASIRVWKDRTGPDYVIEWINSYWAVERREGWWMYKRFPWARRRVLKWLGLR